MSKKDILRIIIALILVLMLIIYVFTNNEDYIEIMFFVLALLTIYASKYQKKP